MKAPDAAKKVYGLAEPALIEAKEYRVCGKYIDPESIDRDVDMFHRNLDRAEQPRFGKELRSFAENRFTNKATTLVALLVVNDRKAEAEEVVKKAEAAWDDPKFRAALADAMKGNVPEPWPKRRAR